ncbi:MAG: hypothetical protein AAFX87_09525 [Bacteroidota bacterium]
MKKEADYLSDISEIRSIMERSSRFISLSGLSGVLAGVYALIGAYAAYKILYTEDDTVYDAFTIGQHSGRFILLTLDGLIVLGLAVGTGAFLSVRRAKQQQQSIWDESAKRLLINLLIPLVTGGVFVLLLYLRDYYSLIIPATLIFYGLSLINASKYTLTDIRYLGFSEIALGLIAAYFYGYGLLFWVVGFGVLHIVYGALMYFKYEK